MNQTTNKQLKVKTAYFNSKPSAITNYNEIKETLQLSVQEISKKKGQWLSDC